MAVEPEAVNRGGIRLMAGGALAFSVMALLVKLAGERIPTQEIVLFRSLVVAAIAYIGLTRLGVSPVGRNRRLLMLRGLVGFGALSCFYYAVIHLPLADATVIQFLNPAFTLLLAAPFLGEPLRRREGALVVVCLIGVVVMTKPAVLFGGAARLDPAAVAVALFGALLTAAAYVMVRELGKTEHALVIVLHFALVSAAISAVPTAFSAVLPTLEETLVLVGVGVTTLVGQVFVTKGLRIERAGRATAIGYLQVPFAAAWSLIAFRVIPDRWALMGAALVAVGVLLIAQSGTSAIQPAATASTQDFGRHGGPARKPT